MRTKTFIKFKNVDETRLIKFKNIFKTLEKKIFKFKNILNVFLLSLNYNEMSFYTVIQIIIHHKNEITQRKTIKLIKIKI